MHLRKREPRRPETRAALPPPAIRVSGLRLAHGGGRVVALADVRLDVAPGEHVAILGPSGAGKSSLLAVLAGQAAPSAGTAEVPGRTARIHQDLRLVPAATALENVLHGALGRLSLARSVRFPTAERRRAEALLRRVGLGHRLHAPVRTLSGGEAQRVAIARALMQDPEILLADEPVASLDSDNAASIMALLNSLRRERGLTLVSVLHDRHLAEAHADRIVELAAGRIVAETRCRAGGPDDSRPRRAAQGAGPAAQAPGAGPAEAPAPVRPSRLPGWGLALGAFAAVALSAGVLVSPGARAGDAFGEAAAFLARLVPGPAELAEVPWADLLSALLETLRMAVLGTALAAVAALPLAALAARNVAPRLIGLPLRAALNVWRAIPSIVWALLFVAAVGLGTLAGVTALAAYSLGYLTKFFYEAFEGAETTAAAALREIGASGPQRFLHAVWPEARPALAAALLFMVEYNVRAASVLGIVGAGGIGYELKLAVDWSNWHVVGAILALLAVAVIAVDSLSAAIRRRIA